MFKTLLISFLSILYSIGSKPSKYGQVRPNGHISVLLIQHPVKCPRDHGNNVSTNYITCPADAKNSRIKLPFLVMIIKNLKKYFTFEVQVLDDKNVRKDSAHQTIINNKSEAIHLHNAHETRRGLESNSVQLVRLH